MPRAIWKGAVTFGLVNVPVRLYTATQEKEIRFHQVHEADGGRIRLRRVCSVDGEEVATSDIAKGYETADGRLVVLNDEDLAELPVSSSRDIEVHEFVPREQIDPVFLGKTYYLEPDARAAKPYALLRQALLDTERMAVVTYALRQKESLAVLRVRDDVIVLQQMLWPDEVRVPEFENVGTDADLRPQEVKMAASLVESMAADFEPDRYSDGYRTAVEQLIEAKLEGGEVRETPDSEVAPGGRSGEVVDLLTALQNSVDRARASRGGADDAPAPAATEEEAPAKPARKRSAAKAAPAPEPVADEAPAEEAAPARKRRTPAKVSSIDEAAPARKGRAAKAVPSIAPDESAEDEQETRRPARRTATRKSA